MDKKNKGSTYVNLITFTFWKQDPLYFIFNTPPSLQLPKGDVEGAVWTVRDSAQKAFLVFGNTIHCKKDTLVSPMLFQHVFWFYLCVCCKLCSLND